MATHATTVPASNTNLAPSIRSKLGALRRRIRFYVWVEGICLALIWLGITFWLMLGLDYLIVYLGSNELPVWTRAWLLLRMGMVLAFILFYWVFARAFVRLPDHSMAVLLERRFKDFGDSLVTAVEMDETPDHAEEFNPEMLAVANERAQANIGQVRLGEVFNSRRLVWKVVLVVLLLLPVGLAWGDSLRIGVDRLYFLSNTTWPRSARIEVVGIQVQRSVVDPNIDAPPIVHFKDHHVKVAEHSSLTLRVKADVTARRVPNYCTIYYRTADGDRGRVTMKKIGRPRDKYQLYTFDEQPLKGILSTTTFSVQGYDHHLRGFTIDVVDNPAVIETLLDCEFPAYMVNEELSFWLPRTLNLTTSTELPVGTKITIRARSNKELEKAVVVDVATQERTEIVMDPSSDTRDEFSYEIPSLKSDLTLEVTLFDTDGVMTEEPHRIFIAAKPDDEPQVDVLLRGIGTAVTPDVVIPVTGKVVDDYAVDKTWFEIRIDDARTVRFPTKLAAGGKLDSRLDFREQRAAEDGLQLTVGNKMQLTVKSSDKFNLEGVEPNEGAGDTYQLEVVSPEQLLAVLERRELGLRRRFEQIIDEVSAMRDSLTRVRVGLSGKVSETETEPEAGDDASNEEAKERRARSLRLLWTQRSLIQSQKSAQEVLGVAGSFDDIREELINNRVDSEDRKTRLQEQIAAPLKEIGGVMFPDLDQLLEDLETSLDDAAKGPPAAKRALEQADDILVEMDSVLQKMLELETFNELVDIVRGLIKDQGDLIETTEKERKRQALELLK